MTGLVLFALHPLIFVPSLKFFGHINETVARNYGEDKVVLSPLFKNINMNYIMLIKYAAKAR